jgi:hypothetical protein
MNDEKQQAEQHEEQQLLHLVFGGELTDLGKVHFRDLQGLDLVGIYPDYQSAFDAWKQAAHQTVDNAHMRYFIVHMHRLFDPQDNKDVEVE